MSSPAGTGVVRALEDILNKDFTGTGASVAEFSWIRERLASKRLVATARRGEGVGSQQPVRSNAANAKFSPVQKSPNVASFSTVDKENAARSPSGVISEHGPMKASSLGLLQLRRLLRALGQPTVGLKPALTARLEEAVSSGLVKSYVAKAKGGTPASYECVVDLQKARAVLSLAESLVKAGPAGPPHEGAGKKPKNSSAKKEPAADNEGPEEPEAKPVKVQDGGVINVEGSERTEAKSMQAVATAPPEDGEGRQQEAETGDVTHTSVASGSGASNKSGMERKLSKEVMEGVVAKVRTAARRSASPERPQEVTPKTKNAMLRKEMEERIHRETIRRSGETKQPVDMAPAESVENAPLPTPVTVPAAPTATAPKAPSVPSEPPAGVEVESDSVPRREGEAPPPPPLPAEETAAAGTAFPVTETHTRSTPPAPPSNTSIPSAGQASASPAKQGTQHSNKGVWRPTPPSLTAGVSSSSSTMNTPLSPMAKARAGGPQTPTRFGTIRTFSNKTLATNSPRKGSASMFSGNTNADSPLKAAAHLALNRMASADELEPTSSGSKKAFDFWKKKDTAQSPKKPTPVATGATGRALGFSAFRGEGATKNQQGKEEKGPAAASSVGGSHQRGEGAAGAGSTSNAVRLPVDNTEVFSAPTPDSVPRPAYAPVPTTGTTTTATATPQQPCGGGDGGGGIKADSATAAQRVQFAQKTREKVQVATKRAEEAKAKTSKLKGGEEEGERDKVADADTARWDIQAAQEEEARERAFKASAERARAEAARAEAQAAKKEEEAQRAAAVRKEEEAARKEEEARRAAELARRAAEAAKKAEQARQQEARRQEEAAAAGRKRAQQQAEAEARRKEEEAQRKEELRRARAEAARLLQEERVREEQAKRAAAAEDERVKRARQVERAEEARLLLLAQEKGKKGGGGGGGQKAAATAAASQAPPMPPRPTGDGKITGNHIKPPTPPRPGHGQPPATPPRTGVRSTGTPPKMPERPVNAAAEASTAHNLALENKKKEIMARMESMRNAKMTPAPSGVTSAVSAIPPAKPKGITPPHTVETSAFTVPGSPATGLGGGGGGGGGMGGTSPADGDGEQLEGQDRESYDEYHMDEPGSGSEESEEEGEEPVQEIVEPQEKYHDKSGIPDWARGATLARILDKQYGGPTPINPDTIFPEFFTCDLERIFNTKKSKWDRSSSGNWQRDRLTIAEKLAYARAMGFDYNANTGPNAKK